MTYVHPAFYKCCKIGLVLSLAISTTVLQGCTPSWFTAGEFDYEGTGGGQDLIYIDLPFADGYSVKCVQGTGDSYSHAYNSTRYDVDLCTPNNVDDYVYAPVAGVAYVHQSDPGAGFGTHVNIDLGDGTYITIAHLKNVFINSSEEVAKGQLLGFEGTTGNSGGDHVHIGRHLGLATKDAGAGTSIEGLAFNLKWPGGEELVVDMVCDLSWGEYYISDLATNLWHPNGSLLKSPKENTVYLLEDLSIRPFADETAFWSRNYDFSDLSLVSEEELDCYNFGSLISHEGQMQVVVNEGGMWLLIGDRTDSDRSRLKVQTLEWRAVLASWGIRAEEISDFETDAELGGILADYPIVSGFAEFRDGALLTELGQSSVYVVSDSIAMPIENWDVFLMLDYFNRDLIVLEDGSLSAVQKKVGDCSANIHCLSMSDLIVCGGPPESSEDASNQSDEESEADTDTETDPVDSAVEHTDDVDEETDQPVDDVDTDVDTDVDETDTDTDTETDPNSHQACVVSAGVTSYDLAYTTDADFTHWVTAWPSGGARVVNPVQLDDANCFIFEGNRAKFNGSGGTLWGGYLAGACNGSSGIVFDGGLGTCASVEIEVDGVAISTHGYDLAFGAW